MSDHDTGGPTRPRPNGAPPMTDIAAIPDDVVRTVPAGRVAALGASLCAAGLVLIGGWRPGAAGQTITILATLVLQGFGVGLFQVAYMDIVMRTLPRHHRGVAGSIAMLSRSVGASTISCASLALAAAMPTVSSIPMPRLFLV